MLVPDWDKWIYFHKGEIERGGSRKSMSRDCFLLFFTWRGRDGWVARFRDRLRWVNRFSFDFFFFYMKWGVENPCREIAFYVERKGYLFWLFFLLSPFVSISTTTLNSCRPPEEFALPKFQAGFCGKGLWAFMSNFFVALLNKNSAMNYMS